MMLSPVLVMNLRRVQFLRRASVASEKISEHQKMHELAIEIAIELWSAAMRVTHKLIAVI